jgi:hypothetical protein
VVPSHAAMVSATSVTRNAGTGYTLIIGIGAF